MPNHSPFDISQLPVELVEEIIINVKPTRDLYNLCLVCKQFQEWAKPQLYESVILSTAEHIIKFSSTISRNPGLGRKVRDLCMFLSVKRHEDISMITAEDDSEDSEWTPESIEDDESWSGNGSTSEGSDSDSEIRDGFSETEEFDVHGSGNGSAPEESDSVSENQDGSSETEEFDVHGSGNGSTSEESDSDSETQDGYSETEEFNVPVHGPFIHNIHNNTSLQILEYPHEPNSWSRSSTSLPSRHPDMHQPARPDSKIWMDNLIPAITSESFVYGHAIAILVACPHLRCLYLPWSGGSSSTLLASLLPSTQLQELAIYRVSDLRLNYDKFQTASILMDLSTVQRLTILDTTFQKLPIELPKHFQVLSHLRISLNVSADMVTTLSQFPSLTHLWFAPPQGDWHPQVDIEAFLLELQTNCPRIRRVRVDMPLGSNDAPQSFGVANWELFPFVRVRGSMLRDTKSMWVYDLEYPFHDRAPEDVSPDMYNAYAEGLKHYWALRLKGGGWDG